MKLARTFRKQHPMITHAADQGKPDQCATSTWVNARAERAAFLASILPATAGSDAYLAVSLGYGGRLDVNGRFTFTGGLADSFYSWPSEKDKLLSDLDKVDALVACGERIDLYLVPALRHGTIPAKSGGQRRHRRNTNALPTATVWADLDGPVVDQALYDQLSPTAVASGSVTDDGEPRQHVYVPLATPVDVVELEALNKGLAKTLAGDGGDSKHANNSLLRMPGGVNGKHGARVRLLRVADAPIAPEALADLLGVDLAQARKATERSHVAAVELADDVPMPDGLPKAVTWALSAALPTGPSGRPDRSAGVHRLVGACLESGLDLATTTRVALGYAPATDKYTGRIPGEIARCWSRLLPKVEQRRELAEKWLVELGDADDEPCRCIAAQVNQALDEAQAGDIGTMLAARVGRIIWSANSKGCPGARRELSKLRMIAADELFDEAAADMLIGRALGSTGVAKELAKPREPRCDHQRSLGKSHVEPVERPVPDAEALAQDDATDEPDQSTPEAATWSEPEPLIKPPPPLPVDALGPIAGPFVTALAESLQVPADLAVNLVLPTISTAAAGEWRIRVKPDWPEVLAIATVSAAESGERKSAVISAVTEPLEDVEEELRGELGPEIRAAQRAAKLAADRVTELRRLAVKGKTPQDRATAREEYDEASAELDAMYVPSEPRWLAGDSTPEALLRLLDENGGALGVFSAEGGFFDQLGRYSDSPQLDGVLQGISGDTIRVDRQNRDPLYIRHPTLSAGLCTQPGRLAELGRDQVFRSSGLLARFGFVLPAPRVGNREIDTDPVPSDVADRWADAIRRLALKAHQVKAKRLEAQAAGERVERLELELSGDAHDVLRSYRAELEPQLKATGALGTIRDWGSKSAGFAVRIAAALTLLRDPDVNSIDAQAMASGVALVEAYVPHVIAAFGAVAGPDDEINQAIDVLNWIIGTGEPSASLSAIRKGIRKRKWVKDFPGGAQKAIEQSIKTLIEYGHVRVETVAPAGSGRPSAVAWLHPVHR